MEANSAGKRGYGDKEKLVKYKARLGSCISRFYGPFSFDARFKTYEMFISLNFKFFSDRGQLNQWIWGQACISFL
jgi:hypothetical protein